MSGVLDSGLVVLLDSLVENPGFLSLLRAYVTSCCFSSYHYSYSVCISGCILLVSAWSVTCSVSVKECRGLYKTTGERDMDASLNKRKNTRERSLPLELLEVRAVRLSVVLTVRRRFRPVAGFWWVFQPGDVFLGSFVSWCLCWRCVVSTLRLVRTSVQPRHDREGSVSYFRWLH